MRFSKHSMSTFLLCFKTEIRYFTIVKRFISSICQKTLQWSILLSDSMQFGYKAGTSTAQCSWLVNEVSNYFLRRGTAVTACLLDASMAFDKCRFDLLFQKLLDKGLPAIVVRTLVYVFEEQTGHVKLAGRKSSTFSITNGTR